MRPFREGSGFSHINGRETSWLATSTVITQLSYKIQKKNPILVKTITSGIKITLVIVVFSSQADLTTNPSNGLRSTKERSRLVSGPTSLQTNKNCNKKRPETWNPLYITLSRSFGKKCAKTFELQCIGLLRHLFAFTVIYYNLSSLSTSYIYRPIYIIYT